MRAIHRWGRNVFPFSQPVLAAIVSLVLSATAVAAAEEGPSIEQLLKSGWQIAGYSQAFDNRSTFILFRHPDQTHLVQCRVGYDVTRKPSVYSICYELR
jgi:hypothetical protein